MPEQLKTITVLFADVTGSTQLGERLDPEAVRRVMERYFELANRIITRHGGTVEKFAGDAVMAVFGIPVIHEDDALRAVRAAAELRAALPEFNAALERDYGTSLELRTGVNTGEAVTAVDEWLAVGDAVNIAARLEQAAGPGEILLGPKTADLVRDAVSMAAAEPMELKGKSYPVAVCRLLEVLVPAGSPPRHLDTPMVGRAHQLHVLADAFSTVVRDSTCVLFTLLGVAGVGKSRLTAEFISKLDATVIHGRCLSYGEGITYWPVVEVVQQLLADPCTATVDLAGADDQARALRALLGKAAPACAAADTAWAVRKLFEQAAAQRPLVVVIDDLHWGEQTLFDLIEHIADLSRGAPILLLCMARPELLERRPAWGGGKLNATTVLLGPLDSGEADELMCRLLPSDAAEDRGLRARVLAAAAGNPLFLEEMAAVVAGSGDNVFVPPTIQALLAARLDQLDAGERRVLERGSVEGNSFHLGAVVALDPAESSVPDKLVALTRKDLIRPDKSTLPGEDAFKFRHVLIRDAAYDRLPKSVRVQLHEAFADWLDQRAGALNERDEIIGYHLEQAYAYRRELGPFDDAARAVAAAAATRLTSAGRRALDRADASAAVNLLERASGLPALDSADISLELAVVWAMFQAGRFADAAVRAEAASARATEAGDEIGRLRADLAHLYLLLHLEPEGRLAQLEALVEHARPLFEQSGDHAALASLWMATWGVEHYRCRFGAAADAALRAVEEAISAGEHHLVTWCRAHAAAGIVMGPMPVTEALDWLDEQGRVLDPPPAWLDYQRIQLLPLIGRFDEARALYRSDVDRKRERGDRLGLALADGWEIEIQADQFAKAEEAARQSCAMLEEMKERSYWSTHSCMLGQALYHLGRYEDAEIAARQGADAGASDDACTQMMSRQVLAKVAARRGQFGKARALAGEALTLCEAMEAPLSQGEACLDVAEVFWLAGDPAAALCQAERAIGYFTRKGATVPLDRAVQFVKNVESE